MRIAVFGSGYVGLVTGACLAEGGHRVVCVDIDAERVRRLRDGQCPIWEPGLEPLLASGLASGRLAFTVEAAEALDQAQVALIAVGTPQGADGAADLTAVHAVARTIGRCADGDLLVADKSTVPVGTAAAVRELIREELEARFAEGAAPRIGVCSNPEFLKEGAAVADFTHGERIVIGVEDARDEETMRTLYAPFNRQRDKIIVMDPASAELTKYAANALLATKISFMNEMAGIAEATGADIERVRLGVGSDPRIGYPFLYAGAGYGGSCFPKDVAALAHTARAVGVDPGLLEAGMRVNERQKERLGQKLAELLPDPEGARVAVWGLSFKPRTDDVREAPSLALVERLLAAGCRVRAYDPAAGDTFAAALAARLGVRELPEAYQPALTREDALEGADALVVCTEWEQFRAFDAHLLTSRMAGRVIVDGRNLWDPEQVAAAGFAYASIGRVTTRPSAAPDRD